MSELTMGQARRKCRNQNENKWNPRFAKKFQNFSIKINLEF